MAITYYSIETKKMATELVILLKN